MPSISGISTSSVTMSGVICGILWRAMRPCGAIPATSSAGSRLTTSEIIRLTTTESSTIKTRIFGICNSSLDQSEDLKLLRQGFLGHRLHQKIVGAGFERLGDFLHRVVRGHHHQFEIVVVLVT